MRRDICREVVVPEVVEARDERKRTLQRLIQNIIDFMVETHEY